MINFPEQLSAARKSQVEAQLNFFNTVTSKAVANAEKLVALNLNLTRETMEKSSAVLCQALTARQPADLFALTARAPDAISSFVAYGRDLMAIATGVATDAIKDSAAARTASPSQPSTAQTSTTETNQKVTVPAAAPAPVAAAPATPAAPAAAAASTASAAPVAAEAPEAPQVSGFAAEEEADATVTPIAKALAEIGDKHGEAQPLAASFPAAEEVSVQVSGMKPVDAAPPPAPSAGTPEVAQEAPAKGRKKK